MLYECFGNAYVNFAFESVIPQPKKKAACITSQPFHFNHPSCMESFLQGLNLHILEIEELCSEFPSTVVLLDHMAFCKPPTYVSLQICNFFPDGLLPILPDSSICCLSRNDEERETVSGLLKLSRFPQVYVKFSALFRLSRKPYPYEDIGELLSQAVSSYGANRIMWGSDFPFVMSECGYKEAKEAVFLIANQISLSSSDLEWIMGRTVSQLLLHSPYS